MCDVRGCLAGIHKFSPCNPAGGDIERRIGTHNGRAFAAKLEGNRREMSGGGCHDHPANAGAAGEKNGIEILAQQIFRRLLTTFDHRDDIGRKRFRDELANGG